MESNLVRWCACIMDSERTGQVVIWGTGKGHILGRTVVKEMPREETRLAFFNNRKKGYYFWRSGSQTSCLQIAGGLGKGRLARPQTQCLIR